MLFRYHKDWAETNQSLDKLSNERNIVSIEDVIRDEYALSAWPIKHMSIKSFDIRDGSDGTEV